MAKKIVLKFKNGEIDMDMEGFSGRACSDAMEKMIDKDILNAGKIEEKPEFYGANVDLDEARKLGYDC